jgi:hypothetical protein
MFVSYPNIALIKFTALFYSVPLWLLSKYLTSNKDSVTKRSEGPDST